MTAPVNPTVGADSGQWGGELNAIFNAHQAKLKANYMGFYDNRRTGTLDETTAPQYPDSTMGPWGGVSAYDAVNGTPIATMRTVVTDPRPVVYKSFHQINKQAGTGVVNPEQDTFSWPLNTVYGTQSIDAAITATTLTEAAYLHSASPISSANRITNGGGLNCANLRDIGYIRNVALSMVNLARNYGFNHYFIDNLNDSVSSIVAGGAGYPVEFANDYEGEFVHLRAYRFIFTVLAQAGIKCILNGGGLLNNLTTPAPNIHAFETLGRGDAQVRFYNQLLRYPAVLGFSQEFYGQVSAGEPLDDSIFTASAASGQPSSGTPANVTHPAGSYGSYMFRPHLFAQSLGKGHWGTVYGPNAPGPTGAARNLRLSHGMDLLLWDGIAPGGMLVFANTSGANTDTSPTYKWDVGYPIGPYRRLTTTSSGFYRDYKREDGTAVQVKVNLDFTSAVNINGTSVAAGDAVAV